RVAELEADVIGHTSAQRIDVTAVHGGEDFPYHPDGGRVHVAGHGHSFVGRQAAAQRSRRPARLPPLAANMQLPAGPSRSGTRHRSSSKHRTIARSRFY